MKRCELCGKPWNRCKGHGRATKWMVLCLILIAAGTAGAQQVSPIMTECGGKKCSGQFTATNLNLNAVMVTTRAVSFRPTGNRDLDPTIHLEMRDMSARIGPKGSHIFFWKVECDTLPCWFAIYATFSPQHNDKDTTTVNVTMSLPHTVWLCDKAKDCRVHIRQQMLGQ